MAIAASGLSANVAAAQSASVTVPAMPMQDALDRISARYGVRIAADPDAVADVRSSPVDTTGSVRDAITQAIRGTSLAVIDVNGVINVVSGIVVVARRDQAETDLAVRETTTSDRTGQTLRQQPRNTQVITSKVLAQQQANTIFDALRNAGAVSVNTGTVAGGNGYSVRGFGAGGISDGLPGASNGGTSVAGVSQPVANIERVEVLKGPDALLSGARNLGGTINIVTKKPFADPLLTLTGETGSWGQTRLTIDANNALNDARTISARIIGVAATAERNFGGYRANQDYLFAPSIRFKDADTDIVLGASAADQIFGANPYTFLNLATNTAYARPVGKPVISPDQGIRIGNTRLYGEATQKVADWLTLVLRGQHEAQRFTFSGYSPYGMVTGGPGLVTNAPGNAFVAASASAQRGLADAVDGYARLDFSTGPLTHLIVAGATANRNEARSYYASKASFGFLNLVNPVNPKPLPPADTLSQTLVGNQFGTYGQYVLGVWKAKFIAGVRSNLTRSTAYTAKGVAGSTERTLATTPNYGVVFDVTEHVSLYGNLIYGYIPTLFFDFARNRLPNIRSRNIEGGVKIDLFGERAIVNASYFELRQSNILLADPAHPGFLIAGPGQMGKGFDLSVSGRIVDGLSAQASFTRTLYEVLSPNAYNKVVVGQPRDQYGVYLNYSHPLSATSRIGAAGGLFGRSAAPANALGSYYVPAARQFDLNAFFSTGPVDVNFGIRNLFDRTNYGITYSTSYIPYQEPRNWRLTLGYRFK